ncbi:MAG TPA: tannase/feruloyl esterase family alpha/beta hydrolase [Bryobacteraceae bacterium]|jgi:feruloyl esterase|nr:tannase/feruloyl esterase family alpha/beta hydrolase [Bryobacteraceae bacterium]
MTLDSSSIFAALGLIGCLHFAPMARAAQTCESLAKLELPDTSITRAESVAAGSYTPPVGKAVPNMPAFCLVAGTIKSSPDSNIYFEVWLPAANWNGKFQGAGNGGFAGSIGYDQLMNVVAHNYATAATDTGHHAGGTDATWALDHPEKITDFGYRAIHETAVKAKAILHAFYGEDPKRSYFSSCSNGGRQALMEAQRYPEDYDGILAGAPANYWTHLLANAAWDNLALLGDKDSYIPSKKLPAIQAAALAACDALDGVKDGVIEDPSRCQYDPSVLLCKDAETDSCLTAPQVTALKKLYAGGSTSHGRLFPGYAPGGESEVGGWAAWITGPAPERSLMYMFSTQFYKNMVFDNAAWDYHTFNTDRDTKAAEDKQSHNLNATDPDLSRFRARGGKLILYHGWSDAAIAPQNTIDYYNSVAAGMGTEETSSFVRLFMVPGMQHCGGGSGTSSFGQYPGFSGDPDRDMDAALERWVEKGVAPVRIVAAKRKVDFDPTSAVSRTRPLCAYPLVAHYQGSGSTDDAANFVCAKHE